MNVVKPRAVDVLVWKVVQQVAERGDVQFRVQQLGSLWAYTGQVGDGGGEVDERKN